MRAHSLIDAYHCHVLRSHGGGLLFLLLSGHFQALSRRSHAAQPALVVGQFIIDFDRRRLLTCCCPVPLSLLKQGAGIRAMAAAAAAAQSPPHPCNFSGDCRVEGVQPEELMARSYRQFQMERALPGLQARVARLEVSAGAPVLQCVFAARCMRALPGLQARVARLEVRHCAALVPLFLACCAASTVLFVRLAALPGWAGRRLLGVPAAARQRGARARAAAPRRPPGGARSRQPLPRPRAPSLSRSPHAPTRLLSTSRFGHRRSGMRLQWSRRIA